MQNGKKGPYARLISVHVLLRLILNFVARRQAQMTGISFYDAPTTENIALENYIPSSDSSSTQLPAYDPRVPYGSKPPSFGGSPQLAPSYANYSSSSRRPGDARYPRGGM